MLKLIKNNKIIYKFLSVGIVNSVFGYFCGIFCYFWLYTDYGLLIVSIFSNIFSITFSYINLKFFVFNNEKNQNNWIVGYLKSYLVYGSAAVMGYFLLYFFLEILDINIFISQGLTIAFVAIFTFNSHKNFTFK